MCPRTDHAALAIGRLQCDCSAFHAEHCTTAGEDALSGRYDDTATGKYALVHVGLQTWQLNADICTNITHSTFFIGFMQAACI